jgi:hypothetical protein
MGEMVGAGAEIFDKLEPESKFLTSWSRSRTKINRLRNTAICIIQHTSTGTYLVEMKFKGIVVSSDVNVHKTNAFLRPIFTF